MKIRNAAISLLTIAATLTGSGLAMADSTIISNTTISGGTLIDDRIIGYTINGDGTISWDYSTSSGGGYGGSFSGSESDFQQWASAWVTGQTNTYTPDSWTPDYGSGSGSSDPGPVSSAPEPETYAMLLAGLGLMGAVARSRKQQ